MFVLKLSGIQRKLCNIFYLKDLKGFKLYCNLINDSKKKLIKVKVFDLKIVNQKSLITTLNTCFLSTQ